MYLVQCYYWDTDPEIERHDEVLVAAMSVDSANRFVENWVSPGGEYEAREGLTKHDSYGCLWRFFKSTVNEGAHMTMRIDRVPLV